MPTKIEEEKKKNAPLGASFEKFINSKQQQPKKIQETLF